MNFMSGYRRPHPMTERLIAAVVQALREHQTERFGQMLCNALGGSTPELFTIHDEVMAEHLAAYCENEPNAFGCEYGNISSGGCALAATLDSPPPTSIQLLDLTDELLDTKASLRQAIELLEAFDRYASSTLSATGGVPVIELHTGYAGSPFASQVKDYLDEVANR